MYEAPTVTSIGRVNELTLGMFASRCDGNSGNVGNEGVGSGTCGPA